MDVKVVGNFGSFSILEANVGEQVAVVIALHCFDSVHQVFPTGRLLRR